MREVLKKIPWLVVAAGGVFLVLIVLRMAGLHSEQNKGPQNVRANASSEVADLLDELTRAGIITQAAPDSQRLDLVSDWSPELQTRVPGVSRNEQEQLIDDLNNSLAGKALRQAVEQWNAAHFFSAVRDDLPSGTARSRWRAVYPNYPEINGQTASGAAKYCVFVTNGKLRPGFSDWLHAVSDRASEFRAAVQLTQPTKFRVQVIGTVEAVYPKPERVIKRELPAWDEFAKISSSTRDPGSELVFSLPAGAHELRIRVRPVEFRKNKVDGLNILWAADESWPQAVQWEDFTVGHGGTPVPVVIETDDGVELFSTAGRATEETWNLGLGALVGADRSTSGSLAAAVSAGAVERLGLTIDSRLQQIAQQQLEQAINRRWGATNRYRDQRRGAVVMLDADSGAILAAASYPRMSSGFHPWDLNGFQTYYPRSGSWIFSPWRGGGKYNAPGSTFKPVTALTALRAVRDGHAERSEILHFIRGYSKTQLPNHTGLTLDCRGYDPLENKCSSKKCPPGRCINDFSGMEINKVYQNGPVLGLKQAVRDSINIWFTRLAWYVDGDEVEQFVSQRPPRTAPPLLRLAVMAQELGFPDRIDLLANVSGSSLYSEQASMDLMQEDNMRTSADTILAQSSIGQSMQVVPLQMARVAAAVATGRLPKPYLAARVNGKAVEQPERHDLGLNGPGLDLLREGMHAVVQAGTAARAFKRYPEKDRIWGKTGTANVGGTGQHAAWFVGWKDDVSQGGRRIAFAAWVSHVGNRTGGRVAAPIIKEILTAMGAQSGRP